MSTTSISFNIDSAIIERSQAILTDLGLDMTTALNLFLTQLVYDEAIPFEFPKTKIVSSGRSSSVAIRSDEELERIRQMRQAFMGSMKGKIWMADDFDAPLDEMKEYM